MARRLKYSCAAWDKGSWLSSRFVSKVLASPLERDTFSTRTGNGLSSWDTVIQPSSLMRRTANSTFPVHASQRKTRPSAYEPGKRQRDSRSRTAAGYRQAPIPGAFSSKASPGHAHQRRKVRSGSRRLTDPAVRRPWTLTLSRRYALSPNSRILPSAPHCFPAQCLCHQWQSGAFHSTRARLDPARGFLRFHLQISVQIPGSDLLWPWKTPAC